jgi:hypothetical protein
VKLGLKISGALVVAVIALAMFRAQASVPEQVQAELTAARPGGDLQLLTLLNGEPVAFFLQDGGPAGFYGTAAGCIALVTSQPGVVKGDTLMVMPLDGGASFCFDPIDAGTGSTCLGVTSHFNIPTGLKDGGVPGEPNVGIPCAANTACYFVMSNYTANFCTSGGSDVAIWKMR